MRWHMKARTLGGDVDHSINPNCDERDERKGNDIVFESERKGKRREKEDSLSCVKYQVRLLVPYPLPFRTCVVVPRLRRCDE